MDSSDEPAGYLVQRIREALAHDPQVSELELDVRIRGKKVFLKGSIPTPERRDAITEIARKVLPDHEILNEIEVVPMPEAPGIERLS
jgi:osmotically-inducible protein OsmY